MKSDMGQKNVFLPAVMKILHNDWHRKLTLSGFGSFSGGFGLGFFFLKYNQCIRKAKLEKEVTTLYLTFKQAKA